MARLITSGAEGRAFSGTAGIDGDSHGSTAPTFDATVVRSGAASFKCVAAAAGQSSSAYWAAPGSGILTALGNTLYLRHYIYFQTLSGALAGDSYYATIYNFDGSTSIAALKINSSNQPYLVVGSTNVSVGSPGTALTANVWHRVEMVVNVPASGNGTAGLYVDGVVVVDPSTSAALGNSPTGRVLAGTAYTSGAATCWVDDVAVNDSTGTAQNGLPGDGNVILLKPVADSSRTGFTTGAAGTTSLFACVDNTPPIGVVQGSATATSQIIDATSSTTDNYVATLQTLAAAGVPSSAPISVAQAVASHGDSSTTSDTNGISSTANPAIAETTGTTGTTAAGTWPTGWSTLQTSYSYSPTIVHSTATTLEFRKGTATTNYSMACLMGLLVEYSPSGGGGAPTTRTTIGVGL